jgi:glycopeptide antibiotics resistance protein
VPNIILNGQSDSDAVNLIPLITLTSQDLTTSVLNILLFVPFGLGLPFIADIHMRKLLVLGALFSLAIELLQLVTGIIAGITFRIADVNDVIFNTAGTAVGYSLFVVFAHIFRHISDNWKISANPILRYIAERPQITKQPR